MLDKLAVQGYASAPRIIGHDVLTVLRDAFAETQGPGVRHLIDHPAVRRTLESARLDDVVSALMSDAPFAFKATLFDKSAAFNWLVAWHRDLSIPIESPVAAVGWHGVSIKDGVHYVQPPEEWLARILAVRINLDDCGELDGALRVLSGSHLWHGDQDSGGQAGVALTGNAGDAWLMRPTLLHASSKSNTAHRRRVLHLEFADFDLPQGMLWHRRVPIGQCRFLDPP
jgi:ectoine hydroxylase-related dioxygenase (phytanoyl-CoA dioxygenase family)